MTLLCLPSLKCNQKSHSLGQNNLFCESSSLLFLKHDGYFLTATFHFVLNWQFVSLQPNVTQCPLPFSSL